MRIACNGNLDNRSKSDRRGFIKEGIVGDIFKGESYLVRSNETEKFCKKR